MSTASRNNSIDVSCFASAAPGPPGQDGIMLIPRVFRDIIEGGQRQRRCAMRLAQRCAACVLVLATTWLQAENLPNEIRILVPVTAGSSLDARARVIAEAIGKRLKQRVIVENRAGAGGTIGALAVARSKPDGSTLLFTNNSHVISPHIYPNAGYDPIRDFVPVAQAYISGMVLTAHPSLGVTSVKELVALARRDSTAPGYASSGTGGLPHLAAELFKQVAGIELLHVPYRGDGQALTDVLAGRVPVMMSGYVVALPHIKAGKLRALAVTSRTRAAILPEVPTIVESGYPAYDLETWTGFFAPAGMSAELIDQLNREIAAALATPAVLVHLAATGAEAAVTSPSEFTAFVRQEWETYGKLVRKLRLTAE
jgi:tripartite-type tricarboxylate transporter receptor subunit TctC